MDWQNLGESRNKTIPEMRAEKNHRKQGEICTVENISWNMWDRNEKNILHAKLYEKVENCEKVMIDIEDRYRRTQTQENLL